MGVCFVLFRQEKKLKHKVQLTDPAATGMAVPTMSLQSPVYIA